MTQIKINMVAETVAIIDAELNKHNDIITDAMKELLREHICYVFEPDMENIKTYAELNQYFEKIRNYIRSLFKERTNPFVIKNNGGGFPLTGKPNPFKNDQYILCGNNAGVSYRG